jgi:hypothetical protein
VSVGEGHRDEGVRAQRLVGHASTSVAFTPIGFSHHEGEVAIEQIVYAVRAIARVAAEGKHEVRARRLQHRPMIGEVGG